MCETPSIKDVPVIMCYNVINTTQLLAPHMTSANGEFDHQQMSFYWGGHFLKATVLDISLLFGGYTVFVNRNQIKNYSPLKHPTQTLRNFPLLFSLRSR